VWLALVLAMGALGHSPASAAPPGPPPVSGAVWTCKASAIGDTINCYWNLPAQSGSGGQEGNPASSPGGDSGGPATVTCTYKTAEAVLGPQTNPTPGADEVSRVEVSAGGVVMVLYLKECSDGTGGWRWLPEPPPGAPLPTPEDLLPGVRGELEERLPQPTWHTPAETNPNGWAYVNTPTYFWLDDGVWTEHSAQGGFGPVWVRASAEPVKLVIDAGDHRGPIECPFDPPEYVVGTPTENFPGCSYTYRNSSAVADNGSTYPVSVSLVWHASWEGSGGSGGDLGEMTTTADPRELAVAEVQAIVTGS
jgi:hypothetical protein